MRGKTARFQELPLQESVIVKKSAGILCKISTDFSVSQCKNTKQKQQKLCHNKYKL